MISYGHPKQEFRIVGEDRGEKFDWLYIYKPFFLKSASYIYGFTEVEDGKLVNSTHGNSTSFLGESCS